MISQTTKKTSPKTSPSKEEPAVVKKVCMFDKSGTDPDYRDFETLKRFINDRGRIAGRKRSGLCAKHQRRLAVAIKRARHLGLL